jgi:hypothetical protein
MAIDHRINKTLAVYIKHPIEISKEAKEQVNFDKLV